MPDFLVIGAMKSGTGSLHRYLGSHPDVYTSTPKELNFFNHPDGDLEAYKRHLAAAEKVVGETSPNYMKQHRYPGTAERIAEIVPNVKLICVLRNPVDRIVSHWRHNSNRGRAQLPMDKAVLKKRPYIATSQYAWQLAPYLKLFGSEQIHVMRSEDLKHRRADTVRNVLAFLGVDPDVPVDLSEDHHVTRGEAVDLPDDLRDTLADILADDLEELYRMFPNLPRWQL